MTQKQTAYAKNLRQQIARGAVREYPNKIDDLHDLMVEWGFGDSLRKCSIKDLIDILERVTGKKIQKVRAYSKGVLQYAPTAPTAPTKNGGH